MAIHLLALVISLLGFACAQESGWAPNQFNATMCRWDLPRVGVIRDTAYIDGGYLYWMPGMDDGSYGSATQDGMPLGLIYQLNFSTPFNTSQNISQILTTISKAPNSGAANDFAPQYYDGAMFANDGEFFTYGGLLTKSDAFEPPEADSVLGFEKYWYGADDKKFSPGFVGPKLPDGITRYVTYGGAVNVPSENKGYYFGGMKSSSSGPIFSPSLNSTINPTTFSNRLISVDMTNQLNEVWKNDTVPSTIPGRASPELAWVPVGKEGILIAIGGVVDPVYAQPSSSLNATQLVNSQTNSPAFISTVAVYDIASEAWYQQETTGGPNSTSWTQGCTVVASAADGSSHNIYYYGGFDGISLTKPFNDDVWVLSVPSFTWTRVKTGTASHARAGHRCVKPYPDQMIVIGGYSSQGGTSVTCLEGGIIQAFNLSSLEWMESYDPQEWSNYTVPSPISDVIGGSASGGASVTAPHTWSNKSMAALFSTAYDTAKITNWYPYALANTTDVNTTHPEVPQPEPASSSTPKWLAPVLGTVLGLVLVAVLLTAFLLFRRRRHLQTDASVASTSEANRYRVLSWVKRHDDAVKSPTITSSETLSALGSDDGRSGAYLHTPVVAAGPAPVEAASEMVHELADTSRYEMAAATGMAYLSGAAAGGLRSSPSSASTVSVAGTTGASSPVQADSPTGGRGFVSPVLPARELAAGGKAQAQPSPNSAVAAAGREGLPSPNSAVGGGRSSSGLSVVSPATPEVGAGGFLKGGGSAEAGEGQGQGGKGRRTSVFGEMLDE